MTGIGEIIRNILTGRAEDGRSQVSRRIGITIAAGAFYGLVIGSFSGFNIDQCGRMIYSAIKVPMLLLVSFIISLPSFFILNTLVGLRSDFGQVVRVLSGGQAGLTLVLASLAPYTALWYLTSDSYAGAQMFNGAMFLIATIAGQRMIRDGYRPLVRRDPRHQALLYFWLVIYSFVTIQMAWVLRPFIGAPGSPIQFFRNESWGNAYLMIFRMIGTTIKNAMGGDLLTG
jgi:hypothetical protein